MMHPTYTVCWLQAEIERKSGFVGSGKGLQQLMSQKACKRCEASGHLELFGLAQG